ncbi:unnamed protein product [Allacma fusca]|uniref:Uncharacterized protein n=1 Tax=Allacma fusca TaxID=39272 RepID=A0A8J2LPP8_9HEXA|nr:unnamed protein product [Allacma fusca]
MDMCCFKKGADKVVTMSEGDSKVLSIVRNRSPPVGLSPEASLIARMMVNKLPDMQWVPVESFWEDSPVVMLYFRIGFEANGWEDFMQQKFFAGEHYLDTQRSTYAALELPYMSTLQLGALFLKPGLWKALLKKDGISNQGGGDPKQNGGCLIISRGGKKTMWIFREQKPYDSYPTQSITSALGIEYKEEKE